MGFLIYVVLHLWGSIQRVSNQSLPNFAVSEKKVEWCQRQLCVWFFEWTSMFFLCVVVYATRLSSRRVPWPLLNVTLLQSNNGECFSVICIYIYYIYRYITFYLYIYIYIHIVFFHVFSFYVILFILRYNWTHISKCFFLATSLHFVSSSWPSCLSAVQLCSCATLNSIPLNSVPLKWNYFDIILVDLGRFE